MPFNGPVTFRDHFASIFQSAVAEVALRITARGTRQRTRSFQRRPPGELPSDAYELVAAELMAERLGAPRPHQLESVVGRTRGFSVPGTTRACAAIALRYMEARLSGDPEVIARVEGEFVAGACDPAWATTISEYLQYFGPTGTRREIPYISPAEAGERIIEINERSRIALIADWGTGASPALDILKQIGELEPDILIHLGDVYYSGTPGEYKRNFLGPVNGVLGNDRSRLPVFALSGNHDMYCGGAGYYDIIQNMNPLPWTQRTSYFCLRTADQEWQLLAMDTGLNDYIPMNVAQSLTYLRDDEFEWHLRRIREFPGRTILLSHHQLFSTFSPIGASNQSGVATNAHLLHFLTEAKEGGRRIPAWFWGHEHALGIYEPYAGLQRGRCIGHGAVPVESSEQIYAAVGGLRRPPRIKPGTQLSVDGSVYAHGFAMLTLGARESDARAEYYQNRGGRAEKLFEEDLD